MKQYQAAIIGTGRIGFLLGKDRKREQPAAHTAALNANKRIKLIAGCDIDGTRLALWQKENPQAKIFGHIDSLLSETSADIITVAVNEDAHLSTTLKVLNSRPRLVILEKPVALNTEEAYKIKNASDNLNVPVMINHERRFSKDYQLVKKLIEDNKLGNLQLIRGSLWSGMRVYSASQEASGAYSLIHDGTHLVDIVQYLLGRQLENPIVSNIIRDNDNSVRQAEVNYLLDDIGISLTFSGRSKYFGFDLELRFSEGRILIGNGLFQVETKKESPYYSGFFSLLKDKSFKPAKKSGYFSNMVQNAVDFLDNSSPLISTLDDGINTLKTLEDIKKYFI
ncbi:MAG: Gfo/Idh/MocA family oxidoreductase [Spirochaetales bacterium]|nr:Gfo/Idh/MocA family oxidoreductase [Spirochaetales bacterium]